MDKITLNKQDHVKRQPKDALILLIIQLQGLSYWPVGLLELSEPDQVACHVAYASDIHSERDALQDIIILQSQITKTLNGLERARETPLFGSLIKSPSHIPEEIELLLPKLRSQVLNPKQSLQRFKEDAENTEQLQCRFDSLVSDMEERCLKEHIPADTITSLISKRGKLPQDFKKDLKQESEIPGVFSIINVYSTFFDVHLLKQIATLLGTDIQEEVSKFEGELRANFEIRVRPLPSTNGQEILVLQIDDAWDKEALQGEDGKRSCKQIAAILGKSGRVTGSLHGQLLLISIS